MTEELPHGDFGDVPSYYDEVENGDVSQKERVEPIGEDDEDTSQSSSSDKEDIPPPPPD